MTHFLEVMFAEVLLSITGDISILAFAGLMFFVIWCLAVKMDRAGFIFVTIAYTATVTKMAMIHPIVFGLMVIACAFIFFTSFFRSVSEA